MTQSFWIKQPDTEIKKIMSESDFEQWRSRVNLGSEDQELVCYVWMGWVTHWPSKSDSGICSTYSPAHVQIHVFKLIYYVPVSLKGQE